MTAALDVDVVIPTVGRPSLDVLLGALRASRGPRPARVIVVDDRPGRPAPLDLGPSVEVRHSGGRGPAAARNVGWRAATAAWVVFLDDDVVPAPDWLSDLAADLDAAPAATAAVQGRVVVPRPAGRPPTDWERQTIGLETARWITADLAVRRAALAGVGGFDEVFRTAYREDADLALRLRERGHALAVGRRVVTHPVRPAPWWVSVKRQEGNRADAHMRAKHGPAWRERCEAPTGTFRQHVATALLLAAAVIGTHRTRRLAAAAWLAATARLAWRRVQPGPRTPAEVAAMVATSAAIPPAAVAWRARGWWEARRRPALVLFDRDGTLIDDVPYNPDPDAVRPVPGAREALDRLRSAGVRVGVVSNQSGIARGLLTPGDVERVNARVEEVLGPFDVWRFCQHGPDDGCGCRKPRPGMVLDAARTVGVPPARCAVVGDIGSDVEAAVAAGAAAVLVPTPVTRPEERAAARVVAPDITTAVDHLLGLGR